MKQTCLILLSFLLLQPGYSSRPLIDYNWPFHPKPSTHGMVSSDEALASQIGASILEQGGNAVDSAVAIGFALAVTLPKAGNLGGGGFMMIYNNESKTSTAIDYRETAPALASRDMFLVEGEVDQELVRYSGKSTAVPGTVAGLLYAQKKYGSLPLKQVMQPAIDLAERGFPMSWDLTQGLIHRQKRLRQCQHFEAAFYPSKTEFFEFGTVLKRPHLAQTLKQISRNGRKGFYRGDVAKKLVEGVKQHGGIISLADLKNYRVVERKPVSGTYRGYTIMTMPPPSSGGVHLIQMLNTLENFPLKEWGPNRAKTIQVMIESMRSAYADRSKFLGDPDFVSIPVKQLTSKEYAKLISKQITLGKARKSSEVKPGSPAPYESPQTTHYSVIDKSGNMVSNTYTLNFSYGNGHMAEGTGIILNNEMDDFSAKPGVPNGYGLIGGEANSIHPGKRPLSSMTPTLIFKDGEPFMVTGSPGGSTIITVVMQTIMNVIDFDMNIAAASSWPRFHHQWLPDKVFVEPGISEDTLEKLEEMGYVTQKGRTLGNTQSIILKDGIQYGSADPRRPGGTVAAARK